MTRSQEAFFPIAMRGRLLIAGIALAATVAAAALFSSSAGAQTAGEVNQSLDQLFGDHKPYQAFFAKLQKAVADTDKATVAGLISYPFQARIKGKAVKIRDAQHFIADYDKVITAKVAGAVAKQSYATLFANAQGVMIGDGEVWFSGVCSDSSCKQQTIQITAIND
jgi:hypothetical protein